MSGSDNVDGLLKQYLADGEVDSEGTVKSDSAADDAVLSSMLSRYLDTRGQGASSASDGAGSPGSASAGSASAGAGSGGAGSGGAGSGGAAAGGSGQGPDSRPVGPGFTVPRDSQVDGLLRRYVLDGEDVRDDLRTELARHLNAAAPAPHADEAPRRPGDAAPATLDAPLSPQRSRLDGLSTQAIATRLRTETGPLQPPSTSQLAREPPRRQPAPRAELSASRAERRARDAASDPSRPRVSTGRGSQIPDDDRRALDRVRRAAAETADGESDWIHAAAAGVQQAGDLDGQLRAYAEYFAAEDEQTHAFDSDIDSTLRGVAPPGAPPGVPPRGHDDSADS